MCLSTTKIPIFQCGILWAKHTDQHILDLRTPWLTQSIALRSLDGTGRPSSSFCSQSTRPQWTCVGMCGCWENCSNVLAGSCGTGTDLNPVWQVWSFGCIFGEMLMSLDKSAYHGPLFPGSSRLTHSLTSLHTHASTCLCWRFSCTSRPYLVPA